MITVILAISIFGFLFAGYVLFSAYNRESRVQRFLKAAANAKGAPARKPVEYTGPRYSTHGREIATPPANPKRPVA